MREEHTLDAHAKFRRMSEIDLRFAAWWMNLLEEDLAIRAVDGSPVADPTLQRSKLTFTELAWALLFEKLQDRRGLQNPIFVASQQRNNNFIPDFLKRIMASSPAPPLLGLRGQRAPIPVSCGSNTHPSGRRGGLLTLSIHALLPAYFGPS
jgi:hypothetical protein